MDDQIQSSALVTLNPEQYVTETFAPFREELQAAVLSTQNVTYDVTTKAGLVIAKECRAIFKAIRINAEKKRVERKDPIIKIGKLLDSHYKQIEDEASKHEEQHDVLIKAEEQRIEAEKADKIRLEQVRISEINEALAKLVDAPTNAISANADKVAEILEQVRNTEINKDVFGDRDVEAENAKYRAIEALTQLHAAKVAQEAQAKAEAQRVANENAEQAEKARVDNIKLKITLLENSIAQAALLDTSDEVQIIINKVTATKIDDSFQEFKAHAEATKANVLKALSRTLNMVKLEEQQQVNEAKPQVVESEAVTLSSQNQVSENMGSIEKKRPTDEQIISVVALHYRVHESKAIEWLLDMDLTKTSNDLLKEFAA